MMPRIRTVVVFSFISLFSVGSAQFLQNGQCDPDISLQENFDASQFTGVWYEVGRSDNPTQQRECSSLNIAGSGASYTFAYNALNNNIPEQQSAVGTLQAGTARFLVNLNNAITEFWILGTNYQNFAVGYRCENVNANQRNVYIWLLSRSTTTDNTVVTTINDILSPVGVTITDLKEVDHTENACTTLPVIPNGEAVIIPGQCDPDISLLTSFDAARFTGRWHEIYSYYSENAVGSCARADYSLGDGVVDVVNSQVLDQTLDTITGFAQVVPGSNGRLSVTLEIFPNFFVDQDLWVIDTDYDNYAITYSCSDVTNTTKRVFSWIASRERTLNTAALAAVNQVVDSIDDLNFIYYEQTDQSDEGCFYFPEPELGKPVVFPGQCDTNITAVSNFDINLFQGTWYEIETYPKEESGDCVRHQYSVGTGNVLNLVSSFNVDQSAQTSDSVLQFSSNDGSAKFTIAINTGNNTQEEIPFWILAIDEYYNDYALAYSCVNLDADSRAVYAWKLSRSPQQLWLEANIAINNSMANIDVLNDDYFEDVDISESACTALPDIPTGQPIVLDGQCDPSIAVQQNFEPGRYTGLWHLIETYPSEFQNGECNDATYTAQADGSVLVFNTQVINQNLDTITGTAVLASNDGSGKLSVTFPDAPFPIEYWVISTDYESYSLVYSCINLSTTTKQIWSWKLSRTKTLTPEAEAAIEQSMSTVAVLNNRYYYTVDNSDAACFYYPVADGTPVVFRGQCDENINVVTNFDAVAYMGSWYDIESYPQQFQDGTCATADYELRDGGVDVYNTQVVNQRLDTINGRAVLENSTDGSAKLIVTFPIAGTEFTINSPYWVLATDYQNYALVYACQNLGDGTRSVTSWKLSRDRFLPLTAQVAINNVIDSIDVLRQDYYEPKGHTDQQCFYFPEATGEPIQFRGQCDETIQAVPNFDLSQFQGTWYEIETYPKEESGDCVRHEYSVGTGNVLNLVSSFNVDQRAQTSDSVLQFSSNDGSAKFTMSINTGSNTEVIPFWILAIDALYNDYALAYSCVNLNADIRAVYAWKLSRNQVPLSTGANTAINNAMANIQVLQNEYFENVDISESACTALPDIPAGQPIILEGQCNPNIPVQQNFEPGRYTGLWHLIETYPSEFQNGDCNDATYTAQADGSVLVYNTQVINQNLDTITGTAVLASNDGSAKLSVTFPDAPFPVEYWVISTDYESYSLVYSCVNLSNTTQQIWSWKLSRTKSLTPEAEAAIEQSMRTVAVLNNRYYYTVDNSDAACFYYPVADGTPVVFRGQCDENINVVTNFDAVAYMGSWYDIESYPQLFQDGTCATADYELRDGGVDVYNTQVVNQRLDTINGRAVLENSTDGSAKLIVTFPIAGTEFTINSPYWVLATDYQNYALVYACQNFADGTRSVSSWKLSRERQLSTNAQTAINNVINTIDVLRQDYYQVKGHSDEQCFYFPEPNGEPVVFRGQCDETIQAVPNFDISQFQGTWYEIETYPKEESGECVQHQYSVGTGNVLNLISSFNIDQFPQSSDSVLQFSSNDGSAKFTISINIGSNTLVQIPFWVLAIDNNYNDYALAYSCENLSDDSRAVYAWKLSRNQQPLGSVANTAIDNAMANIDVLNNDYFEDVDISELACTALPEIPAGQPIILNGQCNPNIAVQQNFEPGRYTGLWHLIETYPSEFQNGDCNDATYTAQADGSVLVYNTQVINQNLDTITGTAVLASNDGSAKLSVTFPDAPFPVDYWVISTDYESYSLVYSCVNLSNTTQQIWSWKLSRTRSLTSEAVAAIEQRMSTIAVLNNRYYYTVDNSDAACFYYPVADGTPVVFRGQCDENINVVTNFDAVAYMGSWYDIESYPQQFQDGTCATADYELRDGGVDVYNTQVVNQRLDTINGRAVLENSTDGSAKLIVTFPIAGTEFTINSPYWVLATDYLNYALVYACQNLGDGTRSVTSWKLSRERQLSTNAQTAINNVINTIDVLRQDYYQVKGHSDEQCFYFPEPNGEPVVFRGQCEENVEAVPNFDLSRFAGTWNEIETYPKEQAGGQCISHEFSSTGSNNMLSLTSNQVFNSQTLVSNTGQIVLDSTDGSARFTLTMNVNNQNIVIPYWILVTDYSNYALVYSCMNRDTDTRAVHSWKLSRSNQISGAGNAEINAAMATVQVLEQEYYEPVPQTDEACFHLPNTGPNEPTIFPGQCDQNINVVTNFDATRYAGRWFDIESYYDGYEGTCIDGTFTQNGNGYDVLFTQVVNQTLDSTSSTAVLATDNTGKLIVTSGGLTFEYWILDTDYENWALVYSCDNIGTNQRQVRSWKMSRTRQLSAAANNAINAIINSINVLDSRFYNVRYHSEAGCFYYPEPNGQAVTFRGRCDESISVVQNFDVAAYLGEWYDIQSYPQEFQDGQCATAYYSLGNGVVEVYNTQVVNQQLDTINGTAVLVSTDNSAKLSVTFIVGGFEVVTPYWVISTDYISYSLVYSCNELDDEYKRVSAWKLSRTRNLSVEAETNINNAMNNIPVIAQQYFETTSHTDEACFFYPDNNGGPVILDGQCPDASEIDVITNFNANAFSGTWHEISRFPSELQDGECASSEFTANNQNIFSINQNIVIDERLVTATGTGVLASDGRGIITASLTGEQFSATLDMYILDTDYTDFALTYACVNINNSSKQVYSWQLSKSRDGLSQASTDRINEIVNTNVDLFELYYENTDQSNNGCFHYPEFEDPESIELPGYCDDSIQGIANFNAAAYLGRWFETARYPQPFQFGQCDRAEYSLGNGVVDVFNSHVVEQTLLVQNGTAEAAANGRGELLVTFDVGGTIATANYYILATDYNSYALVYSCRDLTNGNHQVTSWKLSRTPTLSNEANQIMAPIIENTRGLREDYYVSTSQSLEDCFYIPEPNPDRYVVFRGQCEDVTGVQNFDIQRFLGLWHEIERYPRNRDVGVCNNANFASTGTNQFQVVDTSVFELSAEIVTNSLTATTNGMLRRTAGQESSDVWVLATDYDSYALLYSCENIDNEYRRVWSAKHSRTRGLSAASETAINQVVSTNQLLYQQFYEDVDQSASACFYYPEVTGEPVTLPGQCDDDIPVVQNVALEEYTGTWYQIERYPQFHETGECTGARYTLDEEAGIVNVVNWEVVDGVLDTIEGTATPSTSDGSAKFTVVLPSREVEGANVTTSLYVLATDYTTYSLAYSCFNVNQYERRIGVWKLSRTRTMPASGTTAINAYMAQREELDQRYFITVEQNDDCEEPSSSFLIRSSIIILLVCSILQLLL